VARENAARLSVLQWRYRPVKRPTLTQVYDFAVIFMRAFNAVMLWLIFASGMSLLMF